jgi:integrase/recombinase XerD
MSRTSCLCLSRFGSDAQKLRAVYQDAREVNTKYSKTISTWFFPVDPVAEIIVREWIAFLRAELSFTDDDPLFPSTRMAGGPQRKFLAAGLSGSHWADTGSIRGIFKRAFESIGLPYYNPHLFRNVLVQLGQQRCRTAEEFWAWALNLGHSDVMTTFQSYGNITHERRRQLIHGLVERPQATKADLDAIEILISRVRDGLGR